MLECSALALSHEVSLLSRNEWSFSLKKESGLSGQTESPAECGVTCAECSLEQVKWLERLNDQSQTGRVPPL
jgi:hypothetical protein